MKASDIPVKIPTPWGADADPSNISTIPPTTAVPGRASWQLGFPGVNFIPETAGGIPPFGQDQNGALNPISAWSRWAAAGAPVFYDSGFSSAVGGYPVGATLAAVGAPGVFWVSTADDNTSDPDTGGANWLQTQAPQGYYQDAGTANAISVTLPTTVSFTNGRAFLVRVLDACTGAATLNGDPLNRSDGSALQANDILASMDIAVVYDGTSSAFRMLGPVASQLAGGGLTSASGALAVNIDGSTSKVTPALGDELLIWDIGSGAYRKTTVNGIAGQAALSTQIFALNLFMGMM